MKAETDVIPSAGSPSGRGPLLGAEAAPAAGATTTRGAPGLGAKPEVISIRGLTKVYRGKIPALRDVDLSVHRGEIFGLLGPNGAGKSTLVKVLMTVIRPTACAGTVLGRPIGHKPTLARVGYLPEQHRFPEYLTARQVLDFFGALAGKGRAERRRRAGELLEIVRMTPWADKRVRDFSKGMRQRLGIAQALVNDPEVVLLDEPTDGVDPVGRKEIRELLVEQRDRGRTVFINSHLLSELESTCDRVAIMVKGRVALQGTLAQLTQGDRRYEIEIDPPASPAASGFADPAAAAGPGELSSAGSSRLGAMAAEALRLSGEEDDAARAAALPPGGDGGAASLAKTMRAEGSGVLEGVPVVVRGRLVTAGTESPEAVQPMIDALRARGIVIRSVRLVRPSLEDLFMRALAMHGDAAGHTPGAEMPTRQGARR